MRHEDTKGVCIDRHIPVPMGDARGLRKYPWDSMAVGDSFFASKVQSVTPPYRLIAKGWNFTRRVVGSGCRVWRTK